VGWAAGRGQGPPGDVPRAPTIHEGVPLVSMATTVVCSKWIVLGCERRCRVLHALCCM
jgi:hypothetical protein